MKNRTIYISGAVSSDMFFREKFDKAEELLKSKGFKVVNPVKGEVVGKDWLYYMKKDIIKLLDCDCVYALSDWDKSRGARIEIRLALSLGMEVIFEKNVENTKVWRI